MPDRAPSSPIPQPGPDGTWRFTGDGGEELLLHDVVGGAWPELLPALLGFHRDAFPDHAYALDEIRRDAVLPSRRDGVVVHQQVLTLDGVPVGYQVNETNVVRGVSVSAFVTVVREHRSVVVGGLRLGQWLNFDAHRQQELDLGGPGLGMIGEVTDAVLPVFLANGWRLLPIEYLEPVHGSDWREHGLDTRPVHLLWSPPPWMASDEVVEREPDAARAGAATLLLDLYGLPDDLPWVVALVGGQELSRARPHRDRW